MSISVNILTNPDLYSPANAEIWFQFNSASYSISNFKYVVEVFELDGLSNTVQSLGTYKIPPRPLTGDGLFTPNKIIKSLLSGTLSPTASTIEPETNSIKQYSLNYGFQYDPGLTFSDTFIAGTYTGLTFSTQHNLLTGDVININKDNKNINSYLDGQATIVSVGSSFSFVIDKPVGNTSSVETGSITDVIRIQDQTGDFWAYNGTRQYDQIGVDFGDTYVIQSGTGYSFLENYNDYKKIFNSQYETSQFFGDQIPYYILSPTDWSPLTISGATSAGSIWSESATYSLNSNVLFISTVDGPSEFTNITGSYSSLNPQLDLVNWSFQVNLEGSDGIWNPSASYSSNEYVYYNGYFYENITSNNSYTISNYEIDGYRVLTYDINNSLVNTATFSFGITSSQYRSYIIPSGTKNLEINGISFSNIYKYKIELYGGLPTGTKAILKREIICNPSPFPNVRVAYMNRLGSYEYLNFNYDSKRTVNISRTEYKQVLPWNYTIGMRGSTVLSQKVEESFTLNTNWMSEYDYTYFSDILTSPDVYIIDDNGYKYPILITDSSYDYKTYLREKLFNLSISVKNAYQVNLQNQ